MPLGHRRLALWYRQFAQQLEAGLPFAAAVRGSRGTGAPEALLEKMATTVEQGGSTDDAWRSASRALPPTDLLALSAASQSGRLPRTLDNLASRHELIAATQLKLLMACLYPLGILHFGLLLLPITRMIDWEKGFHWSTSGYVTGALRNLIPLWIGLGVLGILVQRGSPLLSRLAGFLPAFRGYVRNQTLADLCFCLVNLLEAGVPIGPAWSAAGAITHSRTIAEASRDIADVIARGQPPGTKLAAWPCFPPEFVALYRSGEETGKLDANLHRLTGQYLEGAHRALGAATLLYPALVFLLVAGFAAYHIITMYAGYLKMLDKLV